MSTITHLPTTELQEDDTLLIDASMVSVDTVDPSEVEEDVYWIRVICCSGDFDQFETPIRAKANAEWRVLNANPR